MVALIVGTLLALAALAYVLWPIIAAAERRPSASPGGAARAEAEQVVTLEPETTTVPDASTEDVAEAEIRRARAKLKVCPVCGPRPEPAARYCSRCGRPLA
jgi:hypothetical protein